MVRSSIFFAAITSYGVSPMAIALVYMGLQQHSEALDLMERAYRERDFELISLIDSRAFAPLKSEPRFRELRQKIGLPEA